MRGDGLLYQANGVRSRRLPARANFIDVNPDYTINEHGILTSEHVSIRGQIKNVLSTPLGSEDYEPGYGSYIPFRLMEPILPSTTFLLEADTNQALIRWMAQRIVVSFATLNVVALTEADGYRITIPYASAATGNGDIYIIEVLR